MVTSSILPWWTASVYDRKVQIFQWGLRHDLEQLASYLEPDTTPFYQTVFAWIFIAVSVGLILYSTFLKGRKGKWLIGSIGLIYIAYVLIAVFAVISNRIVEYDLPLQGQHTIVEGGFKLIIDTDLRFGYYLAYVAGGLCIALAFLRNIITGKPKFDA
jgi:hypothetical protein